MVGEANVREIGKNFSLAGEGEIEDDSLDDLPPDESSCVVCLTAVF